MDLLKASSVDDYEVFLSFRGADTRDNITDVLYDHMTRAGIRVFKDDREIPLGRSITLTLPAAIKSSKICVPIFSPDFASSKWCLDEVAEMVKIDKTIISIFYEVDPTDVKLKPSSVYINDLDKHGADADRRDKWEKALQKAASTRGKKFQGGKRLEIDDLVGSDKKFKSSLHLFDVKSCEFRYIIVHGMGGIGKTTLAKFIYNNRSTSFKYCSFVSDIRESSVRNGLDYLPKLLHANLEPKSMGEFNSSEQIKERFHKEKVLIILDDVDSYEQIEKLAGESNWFGSESRIIITTRNKNVLEECTKVRVNEVGYLEMEALAKYYAVQLFSKHAFGKDSPPPSHRNLTDEVIPLLGGLPLSIKVIGSLLRGKKEGVWKDTINMLKKAPHKKVMEKLKISYNALTDEQKVIFLDIACMFIREICEEDSSIFRMWESCGLYPYSSLEVLQSMSLIKIDQVIDCIWMHDHLRDLGRDIVVKESNNDVVKQSRIWEYEKASEVLKSERTKEKVEALRLYNSSYEDHFPSFIFTIEGFAGFDKLRYFRWKITSEMMMGTNWRSFEAANFVLPSLVLLDFSGSDMDGDWGGWSIIFKAAKNLKILDFSDCWNLKTIPGFPQESVLDGCNILNEIDPAINLSGCLDLFNNPQSFGNLKSLVDLRLQGTDITKLPSSIGELEQIRYLYLRESKITALPDSFGDLTSLVYLDLCETLIVALPDSIGGLQNLEEFLLSEIQKLPDSLGDLKSLAWLDLMNSHITALPDSFGDLTSLVYLDLRSTPIIALSDSIGGLQNLKELLLSYCKEIQKLPDSVGNLKSLERLDLRNSWVTTLPDSLGDLTSLVYLDLSWTPIVALPDSIGGLQNLKELLLSYCKEIQKLPDSVGNLKSLERLLLQDSGITTMPNFVVDLKKLKAIDLKDFCMRKDAVIIKSDILRKIPDISHLQDVKYIDIASNSILDWNGLLLSGKVQNLKLQVPQATSMPNPSRCSQLVYLNLSSCHSLKMLPDLSSLKKLVKIEIESCEELIGIPGIGKLQCLTELKITYCNSLEHLEDLSDLKSLRMLEVYHCRKLGEIRGLGQLQHLSKLIIRDCDSLVHLDNLTETGTTQLTSPIGGLEELEYLSLGNCGISTLSDSFGNLKSLVHLDLSGTRIVALPGSIGGLQNLKELFLEQCKQMETLPDSLGALKSLEKLKLTGSTITAVPDSIGALEKLTEIDFKGFSISSGTLTVYSDVLMKIPDLSNLQNVTDINIRSNSILEWNGQIPCELQNLKIELSQATSIPNLSGCSHLNHLEFRRCYSLKVLPNLSSLEGLVELELESCEELIEIPGIGKLHCLTELKIQDCNSLEHLEDLSNLKRLRNLELYRCGNLREIHGLGQLRELTHLRLIESGLTQLPSSIGRLEKLQYLSLEGCGITALPDSFGNLSSLVDLDLSRTSIVTLPDSIGVWLNLGKLSVCYCKKMQTLPDSLGKSKALLKVDLRESGITHLPESLRLPHMFLYIQPSHGHGQQENLVAEQPEDSPRGDRPRKRRRDSSVSPEEGRLELRL